MTVKNNEENRQELAYEIIDAWDLDTLMQFAIEILQKTWKESDETFHEDWENIYGDEHNA